MGRRADHARTGRRGTVVRVASNTAISLDGRINTRERRFTFFGSARDHERMSRLRSVADAVLVGGATFRNWPQPSLPDDADRSPPRAPVWNVVVTRSLDVPLSAEFLAEPAIRPLFVTRASAVRPGFPAEVEAYAGNGEIPIPWILERLAARGIEHLLIEAGGDLLFQFLAAEAIDEMYLTLCPLVVGGDAPSLADGSGFDLAELRRMRLLTAEPAGDEVFLHYQAIRKGARR